MTENKMQIKPYPLGAHRESDCIRFSFVSRNESCGILLYDRATGKKIRKIPFLPHERMGNVYCKYVENLDADRISYQFYEGDKVVADSHARGFTGNHQYARVREEKDLKAVFLAGTFDWGHDKRPGLPYEQCVCYCMHVRGFTKHSSSKVAHKGTFLGVMEKIPYLKETGITTIELQPAYEFAELPANEEILSASSGYINPEEASEFLQKNRKLNYWGYKKGYYYAPKTAYSWDGNPENEFKTMVKALHENGMEVVMQFYFPNDVNRGEIAEILRFWVLEYHVDGFHLMGEKLPVDLLALDDSLADTKLWYDSFDIGAIYKEDETPTYCNLAEYRDDYLYIMRKFLKGDENMLNSAIGHMRHIPKKMGRIHYMSNYYGMTLKDMVSYDAKHNRENGEENRDGNDYNCSWNCGEEGSTRKKKVLALRLKQLKNAMCMLAFTQSTPLIFMGDEFGNTQFGNNNPYCQDNKITWLDWRELEKNRELYEFWKKVMRLRKEHPILTPVTEFRIMDYIACGYPDLSYHGQNAWRPQLEGNCRTIGIMYCGRYAKRNRKEDDDFFYVACDMHWEAHDLALPKLPKGLVWQKILSTCEKFDSPQLMTDAFCKMEERSISVFKSIKNPAASGQVKNGKTRNTALQAESINDRTIF